MSSTALLSPSFFVSPLSFSFLFFLVHSSLLVSFLPLSLPLSLSPSLQVTLGDKESEAKLFSVPDFIGFACREVASRIRGTVAAIPFEQFHKYSAEIIRTGVFGKDKDGKFKKELVFEANNLVSVFCTDVQASVGV